MTPYATSLPEAPVRSVAAGAMDGARNRPVPRELTALCRLINSRYARLDRLLALTAPAVVVRNERRLLRAAVDALREFCRPATDLTQDAGIVDRRASRPTSRADSSAAQPPNRNPREDRPPPTLRAA